MDKHDRGYDRLDKDLNARKNQLRTSTTLSEQDWPDRLLTLPLVQITLAKEGEQDRILTLGPLDLRDYFTALTMEHAREQPIAESVFDKLALALQIELGEMLRHEIYSTIIGTTLMTVRKWYSPRTLLALLKDLKRDSLGTISRSKGDSLAEFVIQTIQDQASATKMLPLDVIKEYIEAIREVVQRGRPDEEARTIFFESIVETAHRHGGSLALPPRDDSRGHLNTPLFEFGAEMRDLVVDYGNAILDRRGLPRGRFGGFSRLNRSQLIGCLEAARRVIRQEKSIGSVNSTI
jgi:hypothetical protein